MPAVRRPPATPTRDILEHPATERISDFSLPPPRHCPPEVPTYASQPNLYDLVASPHPPPPSVNPPLQPHPVGTQTTEAPEPDPRLHSTGDRPPAHGRISDIETSRPVSITVSYQSGTRSGAIRDGNRLIFTDSRSPTFSAPPLPGRSSRISQPSGNSISHHSVSSLERPSSSVASATAAGAGDRTGGSASRRGPSWYGQIVPEAVPPVPAYPGVGAASQRTRGEASAGNNHSDGDELPSLRHGKGEVAVVLMTTAAVIR